MDRKRSLGAVLLLVAGLVAGLTMLLEAQQAGPSIEGSYQLVSRKLPDGTEQRPSRVMGFLTYIKEHRNFNVFWKDDGGKVFSHSVVSKYRLTSKEYTETILFSMLNDQIGGQRHRLPALRSEPDGAPVTAEGGRLTFKLPFDPVTVTFQGNTVTAESPTFIDTWERVR